MRKPDARAIEIQISARVRRPKGKNWQITGQVLRDAIRYRLDEGEDPPGIKLRIVAWKKSGQTTDAGGKTQGEIWERFTPILRERLLDPEPIRASGRHGKSNVATV